MKRVIAAGNYVEYKGEHWYVQSISYGNTDIEFVRLSKSLDDVKNFVDVKPEEVKP